MNKEIRRTGTEQMERSELWVQLEKYHRESHGWALNCCSRDPVEAEEVLQTVYLKILEGKARFNGRSTFKTWLFSVIRNTAADERRRNLLRVFRLQKYRENSNDISQDESVDDILYRSEIQTLFQRGLAALSDRQRDVLQLVFYHDLSLADAAEVIGISVGSARTHYERGKKRLRQCMEENEVFDGSILEGKENQRAL